MLFLSPAQSSAGPDTIIHLFQFPAASGCVLSSPGVPSQELTSSVLYVHFGHHINTNL